MAIKKHVRIGILHGPNLNMLGQREVALYGNRSFEDFLMSLKSQFREMDILYYQSNSEGALIDTLQQWKDEVNGIIINAGAYTHTSLALADCLAYVKVPIVEVHLTNIYAREEIRRHSYLSPYCKAVITGMGLEGYVYALMFLQKQLNVTIIAENV